MMIEWELVGTDRFHARCGDMFLILYRTTDPIGKLVWCWVLKNKNYDGLNGGCADTREEAQTQIEMEAERHSR